MSEICQSDISHLEAEVKEQKRELNQTVQHVYELRKATNLVPYTSKSFKTKANKTFLNCNGLSIYRSQAKKTLHWTHALSFFDWLWL